MSWLYAARKKAEKANDPTRGRNSGKWLVYAQPDYIDEVWQGIKKATEKGALGPYSKVSTAKPDPKSRGLEHVICVYTRDSDNVKDVMRIRAQLKKMGIIKPIPYKTDQATVDGKYSVNGYRNISKYYC